MFHTERPSFLTVCGVYQPELLAGQMLGCSDYNNEKRNDGESWLCEDGCNMCNCKEGNIEITEQACGN